MVDAKKFAQEWVRVWNSHNLDDILSHYSDDFEITTPMIKIALGDDTGTLSGKAAIRAYWQAALKKFPDLHFELLDFTAGVDSVVVYYTSVMNKLSMEVMFFNEHGKVCKVIAHYRDAQ